MDPTTAIALKMAPTVLAKLGETSKENVKAICDVVKTVGCKDQIALTQQITAIVPECAAISTQFVQTLNDAVRLQLQTNSKNYDLLVNVILNDPHASMQDKVAAFLSAQASTNEEFRKNITTGANAVSKIMAPFVLIVLAMAASKISGDHVKIVQTMEKTKQNKNLWNFLEKIFKRGT